ncbi:MAG: isoprenyl transferase [Bacillota bacterium]
MAILQKWFHQLKLPGEPLKAVPVHLGIIMDGNGRWAAKRGLPRTAGHQAGLERIRDTVEVCLETGVRYLTLYAFSTENWQRPPEEVDFLMNLFEKTLQTEVEKIHKQNVKIRFIGLKQNLSPGLVESMEKCQRLTAANTALTLNIAINYGGRSELVAAVKGIVRAVQKKELDLESVNEKVLADHLFTAGQPDPDLLIRPGGERRTSNFLIWQLAYTELYFSDLYWPDFGREEILKAFRYYSRRERRFGRVKGVRQNV